MNILDTNVISELFSPILDANFSNWLEKAQYIEQFTTSVTVFELEKGIELMPASKRKESLRNSYIQLISKFIIIDFDDSCAPFAASFFAKRHALGFRPTTEDMMIAGICAAKGAILVTRNTKDFEGLPIDIVNPWSAS